MPNPTRAKPPVPAWIIRERKRLNLKPRDLAERLTAAGLPVTEGTVRTWEAGRSPHPDNVEGLERIFGTRSPDYMAGATGDTLNAPADLSALYAKLDAQTEAITRLAAAIERLTGATAGDPEAARQAVAELELELPGTPSLLRSPDRDPSGGEPHTDRLGTPSIVPSPSGRNDP